MPGPVSYNRQSDGGDCDGVEAAGGNHRHCRYYATERRRHRYSSFSIMKWFRRSKRYDDDDVDSAWFRDDLMRIRQAYMEQESDYAAATPIVPHRRPGAATWSKWSGSTTTVYSFAYVGATRRNDGDGDGEPAANMANRDTDGDGKGDAVEYVDAATLQVPRRRRRRTDREQMPPSAVPSRKPSANTLNRVTEHSPATTTMTSTRRRNKKLAPPPPSQPSAISVASTSSAKAAITPPSSAQRCTTMSRKKYKAPQPPVVAAEARPVQQPTVVRRAAATVHRRRKGPAPKPPAEQQQQQQQQQRQQRWRPKSLGDLETRGGSNVRRKITQYERDRLMERVDKIERHFLPTKDVPEKTAAATTQVERRAEKTETTRGGFVSVAALYAAMTATNLTELDKRAAEICRRNPLGTAAVPEKNVPAAVTISDDHKNAIVAAVIRKSYPAAVADAAAAADGKRSTTDVSHDGRGPLTAEDRKPGATIAASTTPDDDKQLVRHKRLAFFTSQLSAVKNPSIPPATVVPTVAIANSVDPVATTKLSLGTQTVGSVVVAKTSTKLKSTAAAVAKNAGGECSTKPKHLPSEDSNCYQQLMAMEMQSDLVLHNGPFECAVCLCTYDNNGVVLRDCLHVFCRLCLQMTISHSQAEQVKCPYIDERYSCTGVLQHREIKKILDSDEEYERFLQKSVERARQLLAKESFQCRRPDCTGWCVIYNKTDVFEFKCPVCGTVTCVRCGSIHGRGEGCRTTKHDNDDENNAQDTLENLIDRGDAMLCPGCNTILSKQQGCDWIKCAVCFMEICWATKGPRWGPKGKGDTSAGCMCGIPPGRKCHTDCKYCH